MLICRTFYGSDGTRTRDLRRDRPSRIQRRSATKASEQAHLQALLALAPLPLRMVEPIARSTFGPRVGHGILSLETTRTHCRGSIKVPVLPRATVSAQPGCAWRTVRHESHVILRITRVITRPISGPASSPTARALARSASSIPWRGSGTPERSGESTFSFGPAENRGSRGGPAAGLAGCRARRIVPPARLLAGSPLPPPSRTA